ncbi:MAG: hypothetical protein ACRENE_17085, partial [Polyangiaceae bacterium]
MDVRACGVLGGVVAAGCWLSGAAGMGGCGGSGSSNGSAVASDASVVMDVASGGDDGSVIVPADGAMPYPVVDAADGGPSCTSDGGPGTFTCTGSMSVARDVPGGATLPNGQVLVAGGWNAHDGVVTAAELYDPATGVFVHTGSMASGHLWAGWGPSWPVVGGKVLVAGGLDANGALTFSAELYDPRAGTFGATGPLPVAALIMAPVPLPDGTVLYVGGWDAVLAQTKTELPGWSYAGSGTPATQVFSADAGAFEPSGRLAEARLFGCNVLLDGGALAIGGAQGPAALEGNIERYQQGPEGGTWLSIGTLGTGTFCARAFALPGGRALLTGTGGLTQTTSAIPGMLVFDPGNADGGVPTTGPTKAALTNFSPNLVQLANGDVLAFGGTLSGVPTSVAQVYSAASNIWRNVGNMTEARGGAAGAFLLASGDVLIVGGDDASGAPLATAEIYHP